MVSGSAAPVKEVVVRQSLRDEDIYEEVERDNDDKSSGTEGKNDGNQLTESRKSASPSEGIYESNYDYISEDTGENIQRQLSAKRVKDAESSNKPMGKQSIILDNNDPSEGIYESDYDYIMGENLDNKATTDANVQRQMSSGDTEDLGIFESDYDTIDMTQKPNTSATNDECPDDDGDYASCDNVGNTREHEVKSDDKNDAQTTSCKKGEIEVPAKRLSELYAVPDKSKKKKNNGTEKESDTENQKTAGESDNISLSELYAVPDRSQKKSVRLKSKSQTGDVSGTATPGNDCDPDKSKNENNGTEMEYDLENKMPTGELYAVPDRSQNKSVRLKSTTQTGVVSGTAISGKNCVNQDKATADVQSSTDNPKDDHRKEKEIKKDNHKENTPTDDKQKEQRHTEKDDQSENRSTEKEFQSEKRTAEKDKHTEIKPSEKDEQTQVSHADKDGHSESRSAEVDEHTEIRFSQNAYTDKMTMKGENTADICTEDSGNNPNNVEPKQMKLTQSEETSGKKLEDIKKIHESNKASIILEKENTLVTIL